jgi:hypothetical protein
MVLKGLLKGLNPRMQTTAGTTLLLGAAWALNAVHPVPGGHPHFRSDSPEWQKKLEENRKSLNANPLRHFGK